MTLAREGSLIIASVLVLAVLLALLGWWLGGIVGGVLAAAGFVLVCSGEYRVARHPRGMPTLFKQAGGATTLGRIPEGEDSGIAEPSGPEDTEMR